VILPVRPEEAYAVKRLLRRLADPPDKAVVLHWELAATDIAALVLFPELVLLIVVILTIQDIALPDLGVFKIEPPTNGDAIRYLPVLEVVLQIQQATQQLALTTAEQPIQQLITVPDQRLFAV
jgi:hypothetical protein